jgi:hypothetical protein
VHNSDLFPGEESKHGLQFLPFKLIKKYPFLCGGKARAQKAFKASLILVIPILISRSDSRRGKDVSIPGTRVGLVSNNRT